MATINPYLNFPANAEEAFTLYKSVFGGEFVGLSRFKDIPYSGNIPDDAKDLIMHIALPIGNGNLLMATDAPASMGFTLTKGNNFYISVNVDSKEEPTGYSQDSLKVEKLRCHWPICSGTLTMGRLPTDSALGGWLVTRINKNKTPIVNDGGFVFMLCVRLPPYNNH